GGKPFVLAIPEGLAGLQRSADLRLLGLQCSNTAALDLRAVAVGRDWLLHDAARLFRIRIGLAEAAANAVQLELQASGGKAYLSEHGAGFARRWRESAFVPIVTPSLVQ
ncbi:acyl-CoA dehydrogenase, partial [Escherichia coli]